MNLESKLRLRVKHFCEPKCLKSVNFRESEFIVKSVIIKRKKKTKTFIQLAKRSPFLSALGI